MKIFKLKDSLSYFCLLFIGTFLITADFIEDIFNFRFLTGFKHILFLLIIFSIYLLNRKSFKIARLTITVLFILFFYITLNLFYYKYSYFNYFLGFSFTFLFLIIFVLSYNIPIKKEYVIKIFKYFIFFFIFASFYSIVQALLNGTSLRWAKGVFREVGALAASLNVATIICLVLFKSNQKKYFLFLSFFFYNHNFCYSFKKVNNYQFIYMDYLLYNFFK